MNDDELILNVLSKYPVYYLMFRGGSGGEFLTNLISKYSTKFRKNGFTNISVTAENRTLIELPSFFHLVNHCNITSESPMSDLIEVLKAKHDFLKYDLKKSINEAITYLNQDEKPPLFRCNILSSSYFTKDNTYLLLADDEKWYRYIGTLLFLKDPGVEHYCQNDQDRIKFFEYDRCRYINDTELSTLLKDGLDWVLKNKVSKICGMQTDTITYMRYDKSITFEEIFNSTPIDLYNKYFYKIMGNFERYSNYQIPSLRQRGVTIINYSNIFTKGYLEEIFDIDYNSEFHEQLIDWHEKNLSIMDAFGFDSTLYKINGVQNG